MEKYFNNNLTVILLIIGSLLVLVCMILDIVAFTKFNFSNYTLRVFTDNFKSNSISEIKDFLGDCPSGWEPFISEKWPGFVQGCDCSNTWSRDVILGIHRGACTWNETMKFCKDIPEQAPLPFSVYRQKTLCKKRASENYFDLKNNKKISKEPNCSLGSKLCGKLDTAGNFLCVSESESCPINQIIIQEFNANPPTGKNFTSITLGNGKILYYSKQNATKDDSIYTDLRLSEGLPCLNPSELNTKTRSSKYILDYNLEKYVCSEYLKKRYLDDRFKFLDNLNYIDLLYDNKISYIINRFPQVPLTAVNFPLELYARPYFGWKSACLNDRNFGLDSLSGLVDKLNSISGKLLALMIISIFSFLFYLVNFGFMAMANKCVTAGFVFVITAMNLAMMIIAFNTYSTTSGFAKDNEDLKNLACGDEYMNMFLEYLFDFVQFLPGMVLWNALLLVLNLILKISPFFFGFKGQSSEAARFF